ncbi:MAG: hypothetical protein ACLQUY_05500 [Ktedonobacterales bacterium]
MVRTRQLHDKDSPPATCKKCVEDRLRVEHLGQLGILGEGADEIFDAACGLILPPEIVWAAREQGVGCNRRLGNARAGIGLDRSEQRLGGRRPKGDLESLRLAKDGTEVNRMPFGGRRLHLFTDTGIAYVTSTDYSQPWVAAVDATGTGGERWRTEGVRADTLALERSRVYYACLHADPHMPRHRDKIAEVGALDSETGAPLWSWRSPGDTGALLRLWGLRTPAMLVDATKKSWRTVESILASPGYRVSRRRALRSEFKVGQCRRPYALHGANNALWLEARDGLVFVGTRLGLFALAGDDGHLCWHALPDIDLSFVEPALPPV